MRLSFHGAAGTVTGSRHLLTHGGRRTLVDAGMFQGLKALRLRNWDPPAFNPRAVDTVLLTHCHIDHIGILPRLVKQGFDGPVRCTPATVELAGLLLRDSARLQEEDAAYANRHGYSRHAPARPLFDQADAEAALSLFEAVPYGTWTDLGAGARARFVNVGHILGSACVEVRVPSGGREVTLVFSGDVGRYDAPLHLDPDLRPACDVLVVESTYGDRIHDDEPFLEQVRGAFLRTFRRGGVVLIPAFAVGRTQQVTLVLRQWMEAGELPEVPIHIDSPMAVDATAIYQRHLHDRNLDPDIVRDGESRIFPRNVRYHRSVDESKALNRLQGPAVIVSASGMLTAGRVVHHLRQRGPDPHNCILLVGFQAAGTRGRALQEGQHTLRMHGMDVEVRAEVVNVDGLSAHGDAREMLRWVTSAPPPRATFVVHGEPSGSEAMARHLEREVGGIVRIPVMDESVDLETMLGGA
ncbi:MAG: MBL fold metallo-hydrolase [Deltaproteobacteria bacterium]|nr:MBL fold metallo-hydrolase [Deltaproteobacteria bacterium]